MPTIELIKGTEAIEEAVRASLYEAVLDILGATGTILPIGDPKHGLVTASTFKTVGGEQVAFTWSEPPNDFDTKPGYKALAPVVTFNGADEEADTPDAAYWTRGSGGAGSDLAFSVGAWIKPDVTTLQYILSKFDNTTASTKREWDFTFSTYIEALLRDESAGAYIGRNSSGGPALVAGTWYFIGMTYDGSEAASGINLYKDGTAVDDADSSGGVYTAMEDTASLVRLGYRQGASGTENFFDGKMAGGPLSPFFTQKELTADEVLRLYEIGRRALGL
ncbi:MAG: hypothetical protein O3A47_03105 [Chloroflexi bacterium]|nr:hypothetical protein [Chloroflexota bacterium]